VPSPAGGHDYAKKAESAESTEEDEELQPLRQQRDNMEKCLLSIYSCKSDNNKFQFYTNLPNYEVFTALCKYLRGRALTYKYGFRKWKGIKHLEMRGSLSVSDASNRMLTFEEEFFIVLVKLKTGRMNQDLAYSFGVSTGFISELMTTWLSFLSTELKMLFEMPDCDEAMRSDGVPAVFGKTAHLVAIIDCTELMLQKASDLHERKRTFSNYKNHDTVKFMVSMSPQLCVNYVSEAWGGRASDRHITLSSRPFLDKLEPGSQVMADRGFTISDELRSMGIKIIMPSFKGRGRSQMTPAECIHSQQVAKARIHIERIIQRIRTFHILASVVRLNQIDIIEQIFQVCAYLVNFQLPIIRSNE